MILRLSKGDEIVQSLIDYCSKNSIDSAWTEGVGAVSEAEIALYDLETKQFSKKFLQEPLEVISLSGNIGKMDGKTISHLHICLGNSSFHVFGGHLNKATVAATCEIRISPLDQPITRKYSKEIGLNLIEQ